MAVTAQGASQTAVIGTEHSLLSVNVPGVYRLWVNLINLAANDVVEFRVKGKILTGTTKQTFQFWTATGAAPTEDKYTFSDSFETDLSETDALEFTLKQTFGTGRSFDWKVTRVF